VNGVPACADNHLLNDLARYTVLGSSLDVHVRAIDAIVCRFATLAHALDSDALISPRIA
jgi:hypothetical protein